jgi:hypothetical protein
MDESFHELSALHENNEEPLAPSELQQHDLCADCGKVYKTWSSTRTRPNIRAWYVKKLSWKRINTRPTWTNTITRHHICVQRVKRNSPQEYRKPTMNISAMARSVLTPARIAIPVYIQLNGIFFRCWCLPIQINIGRNVGLSISVAYIRYSWIGRHQHRKTQI